MKKIIVSILFVFLVISAYGDRHIIRKHEGIECSSITPQNDGAYIVCLYNTNNNTGYYIGFAYHSFTWYLSYKGQRVSDYYDSVIRCQSGEEKKVYVWPDEVPKGHEKYVVVQFGKEAAPKDRRD
ncbi:MAG: hypothetical protein II248_05590 [Paludibacteraceae bacterium]|nr:hypothetical protein [Paludibacteraceae bacterium]